MNREDEIYDSLMSLVKNNEAFYCIDHTVDDKTYRVFSYRLASYSDFLNKHALEARGIMFEIDFYGEPIRIASRPMEKFFNLFENPFTENIDFSKTTHIMLKEDGSLISTYIHGNELRLKSKTSCTSDQAIAAENWLRENEQLYKELKSIAMMGYTVNMEWTSPDNRIVIGYEEPQLVILNARHNYFGNYIDLKDMHDMNEVHSYCVADICDDIKDVQKFIDTIPHQSGIEGYVVRLENGQMVKIKTEWYLVRHKAKDSINAPRRLFEAIIDEAIDDVMVLFHDDDSALKIINDMIEKVEPLYNHMIKTVEDFYEENKSLTRKDYAIKAQSLNDGYMPLYMNMYIGRENDYKAFAKKNFKMFIGEVSDE